MSKTDDMRAMREARYKAATTGAAKPTAAPSTQRRPPQPAERAETTPPPASATQPEQAGLCGHRAISGRTCTREDGHAAKSHRYS
ncbi:hypothetical protein [Lapillicoccus sp.]|uniref:hypothetical protein n=1 Tax=Lapillicoccus sp. TaxID=1909287 RepID=UPI0025F9EA4E|nr:hypothetical protein [Lapillicoccus sp.]